jgi:hypothetical protein
MRRNDLFVRGRRLSGVRVVVFCAVAVALTANTPRVRKDLRIDEE